MNNNSYLQCVYIYRNEQIIKYCGLKWDGEWMDWKCNFLYKYNL